MNDELERIWKEAVVLFYGAITEFAWRDWGKSRIRSVRLAGLRAELWTLDLPNKKQVC
jgi:hypothetical protein